MNFGIIGAGKVGCSLGKYLVSKNQSVVGFYDVNKTFEQEAANFCEVSAVSELDVLINKSDALFLTVPDGLIQTVWNQIKSLSLTGKYIIHCSGALSAADAFPGIADTGSFGYSVHPLFAVSDKYHSYKELETSYFTIEGEPSHLKEIQDLFESFGNHVLNLDSKEKVRYHLAAAICSNHMVALLRQSLDLFKACGFSEENARAAITPIVRANVEHILEKGPVASLTGPVERGDVSTVKKHLACLNEEDQKLYCLLSKKLLEVGKEKNPERDYREMEELLED